jgi:hypothetical protein
LRINFKSKIEKVKSISPMVSEYKVNICSPDEVANGYHFSHEVLEKMMPTVVDAPVVAGFVNCDDGSQLGGHENNIVQTKTGQIKRTPTPQAIGFVDGEPFFDTLDDGKEWLCAYTKIWDKRYDGLQDIDNRNIWQSMECDISFTHGNAVNEVTDATLYGLCMLEDVLPAFDGSTFESFSKENYKSEVNELKEEFKYRNIDFSIPQNVKDNAINGLKLRKKFGRGGTSVGVNIANYLINNDVITIDKIKVLKDYFNNHNTNFSKNSNDYISWNLYGSYDAEKWIGNLCDLMSKEGVKMNKKQDTFAKDEIGSGDYEVKINKSKDAVSNTDWGSVDKTSLMHKVLKAKNAKSIVKDIYAKVEDGWEDAPSQHLKYPIMQITNSNEAVYNAGGLLSAEQYASHLEGGDSAVASKVHGIREKLGLVDKNNSTKGGEKVLDKEKEKKLSAACATAKYTKGKDECCKYTYVVADDDYIYALDDEENLMVAIPYSEDANGDVTPDFDNAVMAKLTCSVKKDDEEDKVGSTIKSKMSSIKEAMSKVKSEADDNFSKVTSLESALEDEKKIAESRQKEIDDLSAKLKGYEDEKVASEKMAKAKEFLADKKFSVLSTEQVDNLMKLASEKEFSDFSLEAYAELGKCVGDKIQIENKDGNISAMFVNNKPSKENNKEEDLYKRLAKEYNIE